MSEDVMVVKTSALQPFLDGHGADLIQERTTEILELIERDHFFLERDLAEHSPEYRQIIPYVIIHHGDDYFVLTRTSKQTEARLHHKRSLGIGGHINPTESLMDGLQKELEEEVGIDSAYDLTFAGILNDESTDVGRVHLGAVFTLRVEEPQVTVRETHKMSGEWIPRAGLAELRPAMETWSQIVYDTLIV